MIQRFLFLILTVLVISGLLIVGCGEPEEATTQPTSTQPTSTQPTSTQPTSTQPTSTQPTSTQPTTTPPPTSGPKAGGTLRVIYRDYPSNLSYIPEQNLTDESMSKAYAETLVYWASDGEFKPELATSWDINTDDNTLTFYLQEGVTFHDGTPFNAQAVYDNVQLLIDSDRLSNGQYVDSIEIVDEFTFRYNLSAMFTPQMMLHSYGYNLLTMFSPTALEENGAEWCVNHYVSTGPFKFDSYERDVTLKITRYDDYWRGDPYPYLDGIEIIFVSDSTIASTKMQAGEGDVCVGLPLKEVTDLENLGYVVIPQTGGFYNDLIPDTVSEDSIYKDKLIREAIEYAIDRDAIAAAIGYGKETAVKALGPEGTQGYDPNYQIREYNPDKAKELLTQAGHPDGFSTTIYQMQGSTDQTEIIQKFLSDVGIEAEIQVEDAGKFIGRIYAEGWGNSLLFFSAPVDPEFAIGWFVHFGPQPIFPYPGIQWPEGYYEMADEIRLAPTVEGMREATKEMMTLVSNDAIIIPTITQTNHTVTEDYVHTTRYQDHFMVWHNYMDWMDK